MVEPDLAEFADQDNGVGKGSRLLYRQLTSVVFPAPRKPVRTVIGMRSSTAMLTKLSPQRVRARRRHGIHPKPTLR